MKIAFVVHGRFDAFDVVRELERRGHDITLLTNYPKWAVKRYGISAGRVRSFWPHGVLSRVAARGGLDKVFEPHLHKLFGRWSTSALRGQDWDVVCAYSGVAEEPLRALASTRAVRLLVRASSHVRVQDRLLGDEERRTATRLDRPSQWRIAREEREYELADCIRVYSTFAYQSFLSEGFPAARVSRVLSGADLARFRAHADDVDQRCQRLLEGEPLRVLTVSNFSFRKGVWDTAAAIRELHGERFAFRLVGPILPEAASLARQLRSIASFVPHQPEASLTTQFAWGDVFLLPSIEDGYQSVLGQAAAAALPIITTPNGAGRDLVHDEQNGWIVPIRSPRALVDRLRWADVHRPELAEVVRTTYASFQPRDFAQVAADFERLCERYLQPGLAAQRQQDERHERDRGDHGSG